MRRLITEKELTRQIVLLARRIRLEIEQAGLQVTDFSGVSQKYGIKLEWRDLPDNKDGSYSKDKRKITLNSRIANHERINFSFCHEFMHDCIEYDDDLLSLYADAPGADYEMMERLCNAGAAELLIPSENIRQILSDKGFSTTLIPELCELFSASCIAVTFQLAHCASHDCLFVITENQLVQPPPASRERLVIIYSGASQLAKYSIKRFQEIPPNHLLYRTLQTRESTRGDAKLPFATGNGWDVPCEGLYFRGKVIAFFNITQPMSTLQMPLF